MQTRKTDGGLLLPDALQTLVLALRSAEGLWGVSNLFFQYFLSLADVVQHSCTSGRCTALGVRMLTFTSKLTTARITVVTPRRPVVLSIVSPRSFVVVQRGLSALQS